jgi:hypothetical protein
MSSPSQPGPSPDERQNRLYPQNFCHTVIAMAARTIAIPVVDDMPVYELAIACEVFASARTDPETPAYDLRLCAARPGETRTEPGFVLHTP